MAQVTLPFLGLPFLLSACPLTDIAFSPPGSKSGYVKFLMIPKERVSNLRAPNSWTLDDARSLASHTLELEVLAIPTCGLELKMAQSDSYPEAVPTDAIHPTLLATFLDEQAEQAEAARTADIVGNEVLVRDLVELLASLDNATQRSGERVQTGAAFNFFLRPERSSMAAGNTREAGGAALPVLSAHEKEFANGAWTLWQRCTQAYRAFNALGSQAMTSVKKTALWADVWKTLNLEETWGPFNMALATTVRSFGPFFHLRLHFCLCLPRPLLTSAYLCV